MRSIDPLPEFTLRVVPDVAGCVRIEAVRPGGQVEQELFCTIEQAAELAPALADLIPPYLA
jgi:hypothetical protein